MRRAFGRRFASSTAWTTRPEAALNPELGRSQKAGFRAPPRITIPVISGPVCADQTGKRRSRGQSRTWDSGEAPPASRSRRAKAERLMLPPKRRRAASPMAAASVTPIRSNGSRSAVTQGLPRRSAIRGRSRGRGSAGFTESNVFAVNRRGRRANPALYIP
jgi:hypothetical protein